MSEAHKCDRCGGYFEEGGVTFCKFYPSDWGAFEQKGCELCPECKSSYERWMKCKPSEDSELQKGFVFNFPELKNIDDCSVLKQIHKVQEELLEVVIAYYAGVSIDEVMRETLDVAHSSESLVRKMCKVYKLGDRDLKRYQEDVFLKNLDRGYYSLEARNVHHINRQLIGIDGAKL